MKRNLFIFMTLIILFFVSIPKINAATCDNREREKKIALSKKVVINYKHIEKGKFKILISNLPSDLFLIDNNNKKYIYGVDNKTIEESGYEADLMYTFRVFSKSGTCKDLLLTTITLSLPKYNEYSELEICKENPEYKYCDMWYKYDISWKDFITGITAYAEEKNDNEVVDNDQNEITSSIIKFIKDNKVIIIVSLVGIVTIISSLAIVISAKRKKRLDI